MKPSLKKASAARELDAFRMGPKENIVLPSGMPITIRERNGDDEDILSKLKDNKSTAAMHNFLAAIVVNPVLTPEDVAKLRIKDKYYIMFKSRIQSLGSDLTFSHTFTDGDTKTRTVQFDESLDNYDWDFSRPHEEFPFKPENDEYFKYRCTPYPKDTMDTDTFEFELVSKKKCRMEYLNGLGESKSLKKNAGDLTINDKLIIRNFEIQLDNGSWQKVEKFSMFSAREMQEIRSKLDKMDDPFDLLTELINPITGNSELVSLFLKEDFFFPLTR